MASTACFLHHHALSTPSSARSSSLQRLQAAVNAKPSQLLCKAQKNAVSEDARGEADAAYGEAANVFGKPKTNTDFLPYNGDGFKLSIPSKWNPSKEVEFPGQVLKYEDNFDSNSNVTVIVTPTDKKSITDFGSPVEFLSEVNYLLGRQTYNGKTDSEGGFGPDEVATANILESGTPEIGGKKYYSVSVLTRTADGDEGGKHQLITATVKDGKLYICKAQAGDKRWFKGARRFVESTASSFSVA
ncbi:hypothetical protein Nepgr_026939 [Nepenthes gracilis]|uniref:23 kDa subunit of oxygen evolving system of photosystem II n=1 Tax=Nepenthes gracilis TaxID=150966 RepID=A0AAD3Y313_NEPGR|nr:hypothetical protein Nepgr_026939 [Nepenthes gracilis]